ncbi:MAG TPA: TetR/AcrR family transcriptional regulator [Thermoanaerobaculia bacterium]|nr:TetR/AcrR family transcriptional regulator [Thermoanaerobaculia bacterium]
MQREEKSERSRRLVLDAALGLFSHQGYRATSVREIARESGVSVGNVYHHFPDKESIFRTLLEELSEITGSPRFPFRRALSTRRFPDDIESLGFAVRDSVIEYREYMALIYVDVIEFDGKHVKAFYGEMARRFANVVATEEGMADLKSRLRPGVSPVSALLLTSRLFFSYFTIEILFNVPQPFGKDSAGVVKEIADMLRKGIAASDKLTSEKRSDR